MLCCRGGKDFRASPYSHITFGITGGFPYIPPFGFRALPRNRCISQSSQPRILLWGGALNSGPLSRSGRSMVSHLTLSQDVFWEEMRETAFVLLALTQVRMRVVQQAARKI